VGTTTYQVEERRRGTIRRCLVYLGYPLCREWAISRLHPLQLRARVHYLASAQVHQAVEEAIREHSLYQVKMLSEEVDLDHLDRTGMEVETATTLVKTVVLCDIQIGKDNCAPDPTIVRPPHQCRNHLQVHRKAMARHRVATTVNLLMEADHHRPPNSLLSHLRTMVHHHRQVVCLYLPVHDRLSLLHNILLRQVRGINTLHHLKEALVRLLLVLRRDTAERHYFLDMDRTKISMDASVVSCRNDVR